MKKFTLIFLGFSALHANSQNIKLETGKKITAVTTSTMDMDMGMGGQMKIETATTAVINITGTTPTGYKADNTITKMKMSGEGAGQEMSYDSDNPADTSSELGKQVGGTVNNPAHLLIDKTTGIAENANPEKAAPEDDANPLAGLMDNTTTPAASATTAFFVIPAGTKIGGKWSDSTSDNGMKITRNYELQSLKDGTATVLVNGITKGTITKEAQGMQMDITVNGTSVSTLNTDTKNGLVKKNSTVSNVDGTMDIMGQSMPITMKLNSVTVYQ